MRKHGDTRDLERRRKHVSMLQDGKRWKNYRRLPPANATWPTCLIISPSSVVGNWEREFETVGYHKNRLRVTGRIGIYALFLVSVGLLRGWDVYRWP